MDISVKAQYALEALFDLAVQSPGEPVKIADIAKRQKIPQKFLELILANLKQGGFVQSKRGAEGGYLLARRPEQITVGDVLSYVESRPENGALARGGPDSPFGPMWVRVARAVSEIVDRTSLADLAREWTERRADAVPNWDI
jgi:Rrf2 family transcriptional regulator, cysteine metabolism repressor